MTPKKRILIRGFACLFAVFSLLFGATLKSRGFCLGDQVFLHLGLSPWSQGYQGLHYPAVLGLTGLFLAICLFSWTTQNGLRTLHRLLIGCIILVLILNLRLPIF